MSIDKKSDDVEESETGAYKPPKYAIKPYPGDTGYKIASKNYHRFLWTWNEYAKKKPNL